MATLTLENLADELVEQLEQLAQKHNQSINEQILSILKEAVNQPQKPLKLLISPETDPTWEERCKAVPQLQAQIDQRRQQRPITDWLDSTELIREDRER
ncbi:MAG: hypothetical protein AB4041_02335 [Microcystaceae cyanobacterium]